MGKGGSSSSGKGEGLVVEKGRGLTVGEKEVGLGVGKRGKG